VQCPGVKGIVDYLWRAIADVENQEIFSTTRIES